jgi:hypothetical protein
VVATPQELTPDREPVEDWVIRTIFLLVRAISTQWLLAPGAQLQAAVDLQRQVEKAISSAQPPFVVAAPESPLLRRVHLRAMVVVMAEKAPVPPVVVVVQEAIQEMEEQAQAPQEITGQAAVAGQAEPVANSTGAPTMYSPRAAVEEAPVF